MQAARRRALVLALLLVPVASPFAVHATGSDGLSPTDDARLTESLEILSGGWVQEHVNRANDILRNASYDAADWSAYFTAYFATRPLTNPLLDYLQYPVIYWFPSVAPRLQAGLVAGLGARLDALATAHGVGLGAVLDQDVLVRQTVLNAHWLHNRFVNKGTPLAATAQLVADSYAQQISSHPALWSASVAHPPESVPYLASVRAQMHMNVMEALPLTAARRAQVVALLGLSGERADTVHAHGTLVIDNQGLDARQLGVIRAHLDLVHPDLYHLHSLTVNERIGNSGARYFPYENRAAVNIFGLSVGALRENSFPPDVPATFTDVFSVVVAHELNHRVAVRSVDTVPAMAARQAQLLAQAGPDRMNYLRSMFHDGFFLSAPQEFVASISNQWFTSTARTLELAQVRFDAGRREPLHQFLFFADIYARNGTSVPFYTLDTQGVLTRTDAAAGLDCAGRTLTLDRGGVVLAFPRDASGNVTAIQQGLPLLPGAPTALTVSPAPGSLDIRWSAPASHGGACTTSYLVTRGTPGGNDHAPIATVPASATTYRDPGLAPGSYEYRIVARNRWGDGPAATVVGDLPETPDAPRDVTATSRSLPAFGGVRVAWDAPPEDPRFPITRYTVERATRTGPFVLVAELPGDARAFDDPNALPGEERRYRVAAENVAGRGPASPPAAACGGPWPTPALPCVR